MTVELPSIIPVDWDWKNPDYDLIANKRLDRMRRLRADPGSWEVLKKLYAEDACAFISDWGWTSDPRNAEVGKPVTVPFLLFPKQEELVQWIYQRWINREDGIVEKSRECGVSWICVALAVWMSQYRRGTVIGFGSRKEEYVDLLGDSKSLFWKVRKFISLLPYELRPAGYSEKAHAPYMRVLNPETESSIIGEAGDNIGRGNRASIYFVDESAFLEHQESIDASLSETTNCRIDVSSARGNANSFYRRRMSGKVPVFTFHWRDDPRKGEDWYEWKKSKLDPVIVASEIDINYEASITNALIPAELVAAAQANGPANVSTEGHRIIGVDVARYGQNETVICLRKGRLQVDQRWYRKMDTQDTAGLVKALVDSLGGIDKVGQIAVDDIGVGGGVTDTLKRWYPDKVRAVNASLKTDDGVNYNLRAKMYGELLEWLKNQPVSIKNDPELKVQLQAIRYRYRGGLRIIESKKDADTKDLSESSSKSPDRADALALTFAYPVDERSSVPYVAPPPIWDAGVGY